MYEFRPITDRIAVYREKVRNRLIVGDAAKEKLKLEAEMKFRSYPPMLKKAYMSQYLIENMPIHIHEDEYFFATDAVEMIVEAMHRDNIFVVCADRLLYRVYGPEAFEIKASCVKGCTMDRIAKLPFIVPSSRNQLSTEFYSCFEEQNLTPNILLETAFPLYFFPLFSDGTAAGFLTLSSLAEGLSSIRQPVNYFQVYRKDVPLGHTIYSFQNKKRYEPAHLRRFKELSRECFEGIEKMRISFMEGML